MSGSWACGGRARGFTGDSEVVQDLAHGFRLDDGGQDLRAPTTLQTGQRVCHEHAFQKKGPRHSAEPWHLGTFDVAGFARAHLARACQIGTHRIWRGRSCQCRHHLGAILGRRTEDAVISNEVAARAGNQRDQLLDQLVRRAHDILPAKPSCRSDFPRLGLSPRVLPRKGRFASGFRTVARPGRGRRT